MFRILLCLCMWLLVAVSSVRAQELPGTKEEHNLFGLDLEPASLSFSTSYRSKYVFSNGANVYNHGVIQSDLFLLTKCGLTLDVWGSLPTKVENIGNDFATELYFTLGWTGKIEDYNLSFGIGYDDLHSNFSARGIDLVIASAEVSRDFKVSDSFTVSPFARVEVNFSLDGQYAWCHTPDVFDHFLGRGFTGKAMVVYDPGILGGDVAWVVNAEAGLQWKLGDNISAELPFLRWVEPLNSVSDGRKQEFIFGAGITFRF